MMKMSSTSLRAAQAAFDHIQYHGKATRAVAFLLLSGKIL